MPLNVSWVSKWIPMTTNVFPLQLCKSPFLNLGNFWKLTAAIKFFIRNWKMWQQYLLSSSIQHITSMSTNLYWWILFSVNSIFVYMLVCFPPHWCLVMLSTFGIPGGHFYKHTNVYLVPFPIFKLVYLFCFCYWVIEVPYMC